MGLIFMFLKGENRFIKVFKDFLRYFQVIISYKISFFNPKMSFKTTYYLYFFNKESQVTCKNKINK